MQIERQLTADPHTKLTNLNVSPPISCYHPHPQSPFIITELKLLSDHQPARQLRSSSAPLFSKPAVASYFASRAFSTAATSVWNSLEPDLRSASSLASFKSILLLRRQGCRWPKWAWLAGRGRCTESRPEL